VREAAVHLSNSDMWCSLPGVGAAGPAVVSEATVKTHLNHLLAKTGCRDRAAPAAYAYRTGRAGTR